MVVRLGFAVATALTPDVLITDEVLAVGDESFQKKCIAWMEAYLSDGGTLLFCSHSMYHIQKLCRSALWVKDGRVEQYGAAANVCQAYLAYHEEKSAVSKRLTGIQDPRAAAAAGYYAIKLFEITPGGSIPERSALVATGEAYSPDGRPPVILICPADDPEPVPAGVVRAAVAGGHDEVAQVERAGFFGAGGRGQRLAAGVRGRVAGAGEVGGGGGGGNG